MSDINFVSYEDLSGRMTTQKAWIDSALSKKADTITFDGSSHTVSNGNVDLGDIPVKDIVDASGNSLVDATTRIATITGGGSGGGGKDVKAVDASGADNSNAYSTTESLVSLKMPYISEDADGSKWLNVYNVTTQGWEKISVTTLAIEV